MQAFIRLLILAVLALPFLACGSGDDRASTAEELDLQLIKQEIRQARAAVQDQRESLKRFRETVEMRIVNMENTIDSIDRALAEMDRLSPSAGVAPLAPGERPAAGSSRWWIVVMLLLAVAVLVIFALKYRQTQRMADENAWPEDREDTPYAPPPSTPRTEPAAPSAGESHPSPDTPGEPKP